MRRNNYFDAEDIKTAQAAAETGLPYILSHHTVDFKGFNTCSTDNYYGGMLQGLMLKKAGAEKPVYISGLTDRVFPIHREHRDFYQYILKQKSGIRVI